MISHEKYQLQKRNEAHTNEDKSTATNPMLHTVVKRNLTGLVTSTSEDLLTFYDRTYYTALIN